MQLQIQEKIMGRRNNGEDNIVYVNGSEESAVRNEQAANMSSRRKKTALLGLIIALVVAAIIVYVLLHREYRGYKVVKSADTNYENTAEYIQFSGNLLKYTPDGVSYINANGDVVWSAGINMLMPMADTSGDYAVVADMSGNSVCIFNTEGQVSSLTMPYTICDVDVASQGVFAVILESDKTNYIYIYDKNGSTIGELQTTIDKSGYPLDISLSDDGRKLFTSYVNVTADGVENKLAAYNFGDVGQNTNADRMVGGYVFDEQVVPKVQFVDNDTVAAFGTAEINIYAMKEKPSAQARIKFDTELRSVFYSSNYIGVVWDNPDAASEHPYVITVYSLKGDEKFQSYIDFNYDRIYAAKKEIIISGGSECIIYRTDGSTKYSGTLSGNINSIVPSGGRLEYIVVYDTTTETIKLKSKAD